MNKLEVTWGRAGRIYWSMLWRSSLYMIGGGGVIGFILGFLNTIYRVVDYQTQQIVAFLITLPLGVVVGIWIVRTVLQKSYLGFRIVLVEPSPEDVQRELAEARKWGSP